MGQSINSSSPAGVIKQFGSTTVPSGFLNCDGSAISRTTYAILFAAIGTTYGNGNGTTTFNVPDFRGRMPMGDGTGPGLSGRIIGQNGLGTESHNLNSANLPVHTHDFTHGHSNTFGLSGTTSFASTGHGHTFAHIHAVSYIDASTTFVQYMRSDIDTSSTALSTLNTPVQYSDVRSNGGGTAFRYSTPNIDASRNYYSSGVASTGAGSSGNGDSATTAGPSGTGTVGFGGGVTGFSGSTGNGTGGTGANAGTGVNHINPATVVRYIIKY